MRTIKFRAWHNIDGWCGAFSVHQTGLIDYGSGWMTEHEANMILEQYTGLKDKNGKEIYEGDIIVWKYYKDYGQGGDLVDRGPAAVRWVKQACGFRPLSYFESYHEQLETSEVVGNIHQNPELL